MVTGVRRAAAHDSGLLDRGDRQRLDDVFLSCLREPDLTRSTGPLATLDRPTDRSYVLQQSQRHRLVGLVRAQARSLGWDVPQLLPGYQHLSAVGYQLRLFEELRRLGMLFDGLDVPWLTFKGAVLAETAYPRPDFRSYGDIDMLIAPHHLRAALNGLAAAGVTLYSEPWAELERTRRSQLSLVTGKGLLLDLHWDLFNNPDVRRAFPLPTEDLLRRRRSCTTNRGPLWTLDPSDTLIHLAAHGAQSGGSLLLWLMDLHLVAQQVQDWALVVQRASAARMGLVTAVMLARCQRHLGTFLPAGLLDQLTDAGAWRRGMALLDAKRPPHHSVLGTGRLLVTSTRETTLGSAGQLLRGSLQEALLPFLQASDHPWRVALRRGAPPRVPGRSTMAAYDLTAPSPERESFLSYVEREHR